LALKFLPLLVLYYWSDMKVGCTQPLPACSDLTFESRFTSHGSKVKYAVWVGDGRLYTL